MKYTNVASRVSLHILAVLFPLWGIALPTVLIMFVVLLLRLPANFPLAASVLLITTMTTAIAGCTIAALVCDDDTIRVSKEGVSFPLKFLPSLGFKLQRTWADLSKLSLHWKRAPHFKSDDLITLYFTSGGTARLQLNQLQPRELEQFFIAFEACAEKCDRDAELPDFEAALQGLDDNACGAIQQWEQSLADRFSGATFTPLEAGASLQDGLYRVLRQQSFGGYSASYLVRGERGEFFVLKECSFPHSNDAQRVSELFEREALLLGKIDHPNIAKTVDYFVENDRHYLVLQHIDGIDLGRFILQHGAQSTTVVKNWARQLAGTLKYLHEQQPVIVHRDITPENLVLKSDGTLVLMNFGAAREIAASLTGTIIGKQCYTAPEQFKGKPSTKSDVYSFGATMHYLLTASMPEPLAQSNPQAITPTVDEDINSIVMRATEQIDSDRPDCSEIQSLLAGPGATIILSDPAAVASST